MFQFLRKRKINAKPGKVALAQRVAGISIELAATACFDSTLSVEGNDNHIVIGEGSDVRGSIRIKGTGHHITIGCNVNMNDDILIQGSGNKIIIGNNVTLGGSLSIKGRNQFIDIGDRTTARDMRLLCQEGQYVKIGRDCLFSRRVEIRTTDSHALISRETGKRLNPARPIEIGDHVWIGLDVIISKGAKIAEDNIIGAKSFVSKPFAESGTVIAGVPAQVVKHGVTWQRDRKARYALDQLDRWRALALCGTLQVSSEALALLV